MPEFNPQQIEEIDLTPPKTMAELQRWLTKNLRILQSEAWHIVGDTGEPAFENSWANRSSGDDADAAFYKDAFGVVHVKGTIEGGANATTVFTLPSEYRPSDRVVVPICAPAIVGSLASIEIDGSVVGYFGSGTVIHLANIQFRVDI